MWPKHGSPARPRPFAARLWPFCRERSFNTLEALVFPPHFAPNCAAKGIPLLDLPTDAATGIAPGNASRRPGDAAAPLSGQAAPARARVRCSSSRRLCAAHDLPLLRRRLAAFGNLLDPRQLTTGRTTSKRSTPASPTRSSPTSPAGSESVGVEAITISTPPGRPDAARLGRPLRPCPHGRPRSRDVRRQRRGRFPHPARQAGHARPVTETGPDGARVEVTLDETPLHRGDLAQCSHTFLGIAVMIATVVAGVLRDGAVAHGA